MKHTRISAATLLTSMVLVPPVMAHVETAADSGTLALAHYLAHAFQAIPMLPAAIAAAVIALFAILRINKRES